VRPGHSKGLELVFECFDARLSELTFFRSPDGTRFVTDSGDRYLRLRAREGEVAVDTVSPAAVDRDALEEIPDTQPREVEVPTGAGVVLRGD
jgi:hypothetical protein